MRVLVALDLSERELSGVPAIQPGLTGDCPQATFVAQLFETCLRRSRNLTEQRCAQDLASKRYTSVSASPSRERLALDRLI